MSFRKIATRLLEETTPRPGFQYLLVDSDLMEELADALGVKIGAKASGTGTEKTTQQGDCNAT